MRHKIYKVFFSYINMEKRAVRIVAVFLIVSLLSLSLVSASWYDFSKFWQKPMMSPSCTDSDNGKNYTVRGFVTVKAGVFYDVCRPEGSQRLNEYFCEGDKMRWIAYDCPSGKCENGVCKDTTPPTTPVVRDDGVSTANKNQLRANWTSNDSESGIAEYQYQIRADSAAGTIIKNWISTGTTNSVTSTGLSLVVGKTYFFAVKAKNNVNLWSNISYSDGIQIVSADTTPPTLTIASPTAGQTFTANPVSLSVLANENLSSCTYSLDGGAG